MKWSQKSRYVRRGLHNKRERKKVRDREEWLMPRLGITVSCFINWTIVFENSDYIGMSTGWLRPIAWLHVYQIRIIPVCLGLMFLLNIWGHITTVPASSSGTLTNVLPHRNAMPQTQNMTSHPVKVYKHGADLSLCYPLIWNVTLEYTATHWEILPRPSKNTSERSTLWYYGGSQSEARYKVPYQPGLEPGTCDIDHPSILFIDTLIHGVIFIFNGFQSH